MVSIEGIERVRRVGKGSEIRKKIMERPRRRQVNSKIVWLMDETRNIMLNSVSKLGKTLLYMIFTINSRETLMENATLKMLRK